MYTISCAKLKKIHRDTFFFSVHVPATSEQLWHILSKLQFGLQNIYRVSLPSYWKGKTTIKIFVIIERWASYNINHLVCSLFWFSLIWISISPFALLLSLSSFAFFCRSTFSLHSWLKMFSDKTKNMNKTGKGKTKKSCF